MIVPMINIYQNRNTCDNICDTVDNTRHESADVNNKKFILITFEICYHYFRTNQASSPTDAQTQGNKMQEQNIKWQRFI